jgi:hypothetical protein
MPLTQSQADLCGVQRSSSWVDIWGVAARSDQCRDQADRLLGDHCRLLQRNVIHNDQKWLCR